MRPNRLIMSAFGPYAGKTEVEFDKLGTNGIYLITGDTGAGKTTIFDAITYALFGEASGDNRDASMFRSKYALSETPTEVELYFTCRDKKYYIKRNPEYERPKTRGEGFTSEKANAELHFPEGRVVTKLTEVNIAVEEILGIDKNQFTQIAMIAQGDFLKLLLASTDDRKRIFQKLFKTQNYYVLQEKLKAESRKLADECDGIKSSINQYINGIVSNEDNPGVTKAKNGELTTEEITELLAKLIAEDEEAESNLSEEKDKLQKKLDDVKIRIIKAEDMLSAKEDLEKNKIAFTEESQKSEHLKANMERAKAELPRVKELIGKAMEIKASLPDYDRLKEKERAFAQNKIVISSSLVNVSKLESDTDACRGDIEALSQESKALEKAGEEKIKLEIEKDKISEEKEKLNNLETSIDSVLKLRAEYNRANRIYSEKYACAQSLDAALKEKTRIYLEAQAGILADTLTEGKPCPVCGSRVHPAIAAKPCDVPEKEEIDTLQAEVNTASSEVNTARDNAGKLKGALTEKEESLRKDILSLLGDYSPEDAKGVIAVRKSDTDTLMADLVQRINKADAKAKRKEEIDKELPLKNNRLGDLTENLTALKEDIKVKSAENASLAKDIAAFKSKLVFETKEIAENRMSAISTEAQNIQKKYDDTLVAVNQNKEALASLNSAKGEILKRIDGSVDIDLEKEKEIRLTLEDERTKLDNESKTVHSRVVSNRFSLDNILKKAEEIKKVENRWTWVQALSNTANGNISGKEKIVLETYIQTTYFERIIERANSRLMVMSDGQYELKRKTDTGDYRSKTGLELDVTDHYNGTQRSVKSLSGGESFKASLALALGLSDEIQSSAGGIKLDTMFVDEGFGSLDDESLSQAMRALSSLAEGNRLVGIISHVNELKDKIDKQIVVKKEKTGGSNISIVV